MSKRICKLTTIILLIFIAACQNHRIDSALKQAEQLKGTRKFEEALNIYKSLSIRYSNNPKMSKVQLKMGDLYLYTFSDEQNALKAYSVIQHLWPLTEESAEATLRKAELFGSKGDNRSAIVEYEWLLKHFPKLKDRYKVKLNLAEKYLNLNDAYQAALELEDMVAKEDIPKNLEPQILYDLGESYFLQDKFEGSLRIFQDLAKTYPEMNRMEEAKLRIFECFVKLNSMEDAYSMQAQLLKEYPDSAIVKTRTQGLIRREEKTEKPNIIE